MLFKVGFNKAVVAAGGLTLAEAISLREASYTTSTTATFSGITLPAGDYAIALYNDSTTSAHSISSVTLNGNTVTQQRAASNGFYVGWMGTINLASSITSANLVVTFNTAISGTILLHAVEATGLSSWGASNAATTVSGTTAPTTLTAAAGDAVYSFIGYEGTAGTISWGSPDVEIAEFTGSTSRMGVAEREGVSAGSQTMTATLNASRFRLIQISLLAVV